MKTTNSDIMTEEGFALRFRPRDEESLTLNIPKDTLAALGKIAHGRDMSVNALLKLYIGQGLRQDLAHSFADHVLDKTAKVLSEHLESEEVVSSILKEIRMETTV